MDEFIRITLNKFYNDIFNVIKLIVLGYDKVEVMGIISKKATSISLRENSYLYKRQFWFVIKSVILNILAMYVIGMECSGIAKVYMVLIAIVTSVTISAYLTVTFNNHLYGYKDEIKRGILYELKYTLKFNLLNLVCLILNIICLYNTLEIAKLFIILLAVIISILNILYMWCITYLFPSKAIATFTVRERTITKVSPDDETFDGTDDLELRLVNGGTVKIDLFKEKLYIAEDNKLVILAKGNRQGLFRQ